MPMTLTRSWEELEIRTYAFLGIAAVTAGVYYAPAAIPTAAGMWLRNPARANEIANGVMEALSSAPTSIGTGIHVGISDFAVIGPFKPKSGGRSYIEIAKELGASYFSMEEKEVAQLGIKGVRKANYKFLDWIAKKRMDVKLSTKLKDMDPKGFTHEEIKYLQEKYNYIFNDDGSALVAPNSE